MPIPKEQLQLIEQLLNISGVQVLTAELTEQEMTIQIESTDDYAICHKCGRNATAACIAMIIRRRRGAMIGTTHNPG